MLSNEPLSYHIGHDGFIWFLGVIEDINDPLAVGRVKARIIGWHTDEPATDDLPWAYPLQPVTDSTATHTMKPGDWVVGFFMDGKLGQQPIVFGVLPAIPQSSILGDLATVAKVAAAFGF
jgi:hypothetical protein